ncbi:MAG: C-terminal binding protein [SAR324 cluster bacterium]|nr:C-terminal binding protein [SAR324 cluster bacterium]
MSAKKKVIVRLSSHANAELLSERYSYELETLEPLAEMIEIQAEQEDEFIEAAKEADALITSWGFPITRNIIRSLKKLVVIGVGSVGVDMVDVEAATDHGVVVTNTPDIYMEEVADHTIMLLLASANRLKELDLMVRKGNWFDGRPHKNKIPRLWGQTLGLFSFGNAARAVARRAKVFGFQIVAHDPYVSELKIISEGVEPVSFEELLARSDYLSVHAPLNQETRGIFSTAQLEQMKDTAVLVNTSRGQVIDEKALIQALQNGIIAAAGLDVLETEPPLPDNPLLQMKNVILTPHVSAQSTRMRRETRRRVGREVALVLKGRWPMSCVNPTVLPKIDLERWQPYSMDRGPNR